MNQPVTEDHSSVFSKGGGGTVFELSVQTAFIITLLLKGKVPGLPTGELNEVAFQTTRLGFHTDDLLIRVRSHQGEHKLLAQIKHNLSITSKNATFEEVMTAFWQDFINPAEFNPTLDRLLIIKSALSQADRQDTLTLLNWAKSKASAADFYLEVNRIDSKKKTLAIFSEVLQKVNAGVIVDDEQLWRFLRCLMVLDYDFSQESSQSKTNFLNLLELCKNRTASISASEIWDSIFAYVAELNKNGGSVTFESLQDQFFAAYFELARLHDSYISIKKLQDDSQAILGPLTDTIAGLHLPRPELRNRLAALLSSHSLTIVTGEPGTGKSAIIKEVVSELIPNTTVLTFKADQFNQSQLGQVFSGLGVSNSLVQLTACLAAIPQKVVFIDSLEKLLEGDPDNAFRQLMHFLNGIKGVSVVASSRTYAVELLIQKYALSNVSVLEVALLSEGEEGEFEQVLQAFPKLRPLASNPQIRHVLRSPKYLDFAVRWVNTTSDNLSELTLTRTMGL
ncbi:ATP-binding protein [Spirosoma spitsbergense]|uniref:ATP-binding protein n=1 Tax=Spirosoma spitsbergense TaxID=431554 RepID=UPI0003606AF8|nr:ATP-binding protein [Spirosoma spitsbergense]